MDTNNIFHLHPLQYIHITNVTTNITRVERGPQTLVLQGDEMVVGSVRSCVVVPPNHYCVVLNPVREVLPDGRCTLAFGERSIRFFKEPFVLYPGEDLLRDRESTTGIRPLPFVPTEHALRLVALSDFTDQFGKKRIAGQEYQIAGPLTYLPETQSTIIAVIAPQVVQQGQALRLKALQAFTDRTGKARFTGEEWLVTTVGAYLPDVQEQVMGMQLPAVLTEMRALRLLAVREHKDVFGVTRHVGEEWLVTADQAASYLVDVTEENKGMVTRTVLSKRQFCIICDPATIVDGRVCNKLGARKLVTGPATFFLQPGESLANGIESNYILEEDEALVLAALEAFTDAGTKRQYKPGDRWLLTGPTEYVPPVCAVVVDRRKSLKLAQFEGVYVRNITTGDIRSVMGPQSYLLTAEEELWKKPLQPMLEELLANGGGLADPSVRKMAFFEGSMESNAKRDPSRVVTYRVPIMSAVQIYNYKKRMARVVFGPNLAVLGPHEDFNILSLSAGKPKKADALKSLPMMLGNDFITDQLTVETSDHARLVVLFSVNNHFEYDEKDEESLKRLFSVPDYIGFACRELASRIRSSVAMTGFEEFHQNSASIIRAAVFGGKDRLVFPGNGLVITNIDIQHIEPAETKTQELLMRSVQMAIEISTRSVEEAAAHAARLDAQAARGLLEQQQLVNQQEAEKARIKLNELRAATAAVESCGQSKAEAQANAERTLIEANSNIELVRLRTEAARIQQEAELDVLGEARKAELSYQRAMNKLSVHHTRRTTELEEKKFSDFVKSATPDVLQSLLVAGPEVAAKLMTQFGIDISGFSNSFSLLQNTIGAVTGVTAVAGAAAVVGAARN
eukprot:m.116286 g.116286  ORF g.116286 m.116286 type:complete len:850 (-) comp16069_c0_seq1:242-2791(-)